jgi:CheY-like chemotaxis protein
MAVELLWVEEESGSLRYERKLAAGLGCMITEESTVETALSRLNLSRFDVVVADIILPPDEFSRRRSHVHPEAGIQFLRALRDPRRVGQTPHDVPAMVVSAVVSPDKRSLAIKLLGDDRFYIAKPVDKGAFLSALRELIGVATQSAPCAPEAAGQ